MRQILPARFGTIFHSSMPKVPNNTKCTLFSASKWINEYGGAFGANSTERDSQMESNASSHHRPASEVEAKKIAPMHPRTAQTRWLLLSNSPATHCAMAWQEPRSCLPVLTKHRLAARLLRNSSRQFQWDELESERFRLGA